MSTGGIWTPVNGARTAIFSAGFDLTATSTYKVALFAQTSNLTVASTTFAGVTNELGTANGYTAGGVGVSLTLTGTTSVTATPTAPIVWAASGGSITARWAALYKIGGNVLAFMLLDPSPADVTATTGNNLTISNSVPVFTFA